MFPDCSVIGKEKVKNLTCSLTGKWVKNKKYGWQFSFNKIDLDNNGLLFFLTNVVKGLGASLSQKLIDTYGEDQLIEILDNDSDKLLEFKGIKEKKLAKITKSWNKYKQMKSLSDFFTLRGANITSNMLLRIYNHFKDNQTDVVSLINKNPYVLTEVRGIGFKSCDKIALSIGIGKYSYERIKALIDYILLSQASDNGHTYLSIKQIMQLAEEYLYSEQEEESNEELSGIIAEVLSTSDDYYVSTDADTSNRIVALKAYKYKENYIRDFINRKSNSFKVSSEEANKFIKEKEQQLGIKLSEQQHKAVFEIATTGTGIFLLCGYAGTGKSTISKIILDFYNKYFFERKDIVCCAFTGMASKRIKDLTGYASSTIHSLLQFKGEGFFYNKNNKLPHKVILLDEASMVNLNIFYSLVSALSDDAIFIVVGDNAQLPPIGAANVFNDLLGYDIPKVKLTKIYRQSSNSVLTYFANFIRNGKVPDNYDDWYSDWTFIKKDIPNYFALKKKLTDKEMKEIRNDHYDKMLEDTLRNIDRIITEKNLTGTKRIWDIQVITPMKVTVLGTENLNNLLQEKLNNISGKSVIIRDRLLKQYDKVIHLKNKNMPCISYNDYKNDPASIENTNTSRIYNGNLGIVIDINEDDEEFYVLYPDNTVVIYNFDDYKNIIDLGYALTIHKTQGNQFKYVFIPVTNSFFIMLNSKLMYTAITRAINMACLICQDYAFKRGCTNIQETVRQTFLSKWIRDANRQAANA